ncbi:hypothetical protein [Ferrimonas balearica]|uniref:hypothetical protein n=1 Tax=Ferrimonas balearica TaxID=44012 RepID=UPI001C589137|nr:hypothetical protein [Ferrimonas balearica]MBW3163500.1 hypothetical protein [Ferrimonas balearica]
MALCFWIGVHGFFIYWLVTSTRAKKKSVLAEFLSEVKRFPVKNITILLNALCIEVFFLGVIGPDFFVFMVPTPFGNFPSWGVGLCAAIALTPFMFAGGQGG